MRPHGGAYERLFLEVQEMRWQSILVCVAVLLSSPVQSCKAGLVAHWKFDEGSGTTAYDSANDHHGTVYGAQWTTGAYDGALSFDGVDDYVGVPDADSLDLTVFTIEARFEIDALPIGPVQGFTILSKEEDPSTDHANYYVMVFYDHNWGTGIPKIACAFEDKYDYNYWLTHDIDESYAGRSVHFACTLDGDDWNMYIDGTEVATNMYWNTVPITGLLGQVPATGNSQLSIGAFASQIPGLGGGYFKGIIDEVRIYDEALSPWPGPPTNLTVTVNGDICFDWDGIIGAAMYSVDVEGLVIFDYHDGELVHLDETLYVELSFGTGDRADGGEKSDSDLCITRENLEAALISAIQDELGEVLVTVVEFHGLGEVKALDPGRGKGKQNTPFSDTVNVDVVYVP
jgi:hypothetical protein